MEFFIYVYIRHMEGFSLNLRLNIFVFKKQIHKYSHQFQIKITKTLLRKDNCILRM